MRASTADRERAVDVLKAGFAEGRLDQTEYADRVGLVYSSRTYAELAALTADLPIGPLGTLPSGPAVPASPVPWSAQPPVPWSAPPAPWSALPPPPPSPATRRTSGMALAAFLFGLGSFVTAGVTAPLAIGLAIGAGAKARHTGERGAGLAVAGIVLALISLLVSRPFWWY